VFADPFVFAACEGLQPGCPAPPPDLVPGDLAVYSVPASRVAADAGLAPGRFLVAGQPLVSFEATTTAAPYLAPSRVPSVTRVSEVKLEVPVAVNGLG
jgi:hypothetical protein